MTSKYVPVVLVIALTVALAAPARADKLDTNGREIVVGIVAATAAVAVLITVLALHYSKKRAVTGCVESTGTGMRASAAEASSATKRPRRPAIASGSAGETLPTAPWRTSVTPLPRSASNSANLPGQSASSPSGGLGTSVGWQAKTSS